MDSHVDGHQTSGELKERCAHSVGDVGWSRSCSQKALKSCTWLPAAGLGTVAIVAIVAGVLGPLTVGRVSPACCVLDGVCVDAQCSSFFPSPLLPLVPKCVVLVQGNPQYPIPMTAVPCILKTTCQHLGCAQHVQKSRGSFLLLAPDSSHGTTLTKAAAAAAVSTHFANCMVHCNGHG